MTFEIKLTITIKIEEKKKSSTQTPKGNTQNSSTATIILNQK